jgi:uncharacterized membrane protein YozB (DUF420 family)
MLDESFSTTSCELKKKDHLRGLIRALTSLSFAHNNFTFIIHYFIRVSLYKELNVEHGVQKRTYKIMLIIFILLGHNVPPS